MFGEKWRINKRKAKVSSQPEPKITREREIPSPKREKR
jgi:hypothetical protein